MCIPAQYLFVPLFLEVAIPRVYMTCKYLNSGMGKYTFPHLSFPNIPPDGRVIFSAAGSAAAQTLSIIYPLLCLPRLKKVNLPKARLLLGIMTSSDLCTKV